MWWLRLGIRPERIKPGRPDQNGRHERMHRTLKHEAVGPARLDFAPQQARFDHWRKEYNEVRPHEALEQHPPAQYYQPSPRPFLAELPEPQYPPQFETRRVNHAGYLLWDRHKFVGLEELNDGNWTLHFCARSLAVLDATAKVLRPIPAKEALNKERRGVPKKKDRPKAHADAARIAAAVEAPPQADASSKEITVETQ